MHKKLGVHIALLIFLSSIAFNSNAGEIFILDEKSLVKAASVSNPTAEKIRASLLSSEISESQILEKFQPSFEGSVSHFQSDENTVAQYSSTSPINQMSLGVKKDFSYGMSMGLYNVTSKHTYGNLGSDARNSIKGELTMDLYKNFFGKTSRSEIAYSNYEKEIARIQSQIDNRIFIINLHKIYWAIILNEEAIEISQNLLSIAQRQELDAKRRYKNGITDLGEVTRQSSQVASKQTDIYHLENKRELYIRSLKELLPSIANKKVEIAPYDIEAKEQEILSVIQIIENNEEIPSQYTYYDDIVEYVKKSYYEQDNIADNYSDLDLEFYMEFEQSDSSNQLSNTMGDIHNYDENRYQFGLNLSVPLGSRKNKTSSLKKELEKSEYLADKQNNISKIEAYHSQTVENIKLLRKAAQSQISSIDNMKKSLDFTKRKYNQARIPLRNLIDDQDLYLQSLLKKIEIKSLVVDQVLDYLTVFTQIPYPSKEIL